MGAQDGKFPKLDDRGSLWQLLVVLASRKACDQINRERRKKRDGGKVHAASDFAGSEEGNSPIDLLMASEPTAESFAMMKEGCEQMLGLLDDKSKQIAMLRLEGYPQCISSTSPIPLAGSWTGIGSKWNGASKNGLFNYWWDLG